MSAKGVHRGCIKCLIWCHISVFLKVSKSVLGAKVFCSLCVGLLHMCQSSMGEVLFTRLMRRVQSGVGESMVQVAGRIRPGNGF